MKLGFDPVESCCSLQLIHFHLPAEAWQASFDFWKYVHVYMCACACLCFCVCTCMHLPVLMHWHPKRASGVFLYYSVLLLLNQGLLNWTLWFLQSQQPGPALLYFLGFKAHSLKCCSWWSVGPAFLQSLLWASSPRMLRWGVEPT